jgi:WD40 repeat protein
LKAASYGNPDPAAGHWHTATVDRSGRVLALATVQDKEVEAQTRLWDVEQRRPLLTLPTRLKEDAAAAICPRTRLIATYPGGGTVTVWDGYTGKEVTRFTATSALPLGGHRVDVCFSAGGQLATWCYGPLDRERERLKLWDGRTGRLLHDLTGNPERVYGVAFDPEGRRLATVGEKGLVCLWDTVTGQKLWSAEIGGICMRAAFSPDGKLLAADAGARYGGEGTRVVLFDAETGAEKRTLSGLVGNVRRMAFSPDSFRLVTADERLRVWNVLTGQELLTLSPPNDLHSLMFTPDGQRLLVAGSGQVQIFDGTPLPEGNEDKQLVR